MKPQLIATLLIAAGSTFTAHAADLVDVKSLDSTIVVESKYNGKDNFMQRQLKGYSENSCKLAKPAAAALAKVQAKLATHGLGIKTFDCYRPQEAVDDMHDEIIRSKGSTLDPKFMPNINPAELVKLGYVAEKSSHTLGRAIDMTLIDLATGKELDFGSPFDYFDKKSWTADTSISKEAQKNRKMMLEVMTQGGFVNFNQEWWHFNYNR